MKTAPCRNCEDRELGCHSHCIAYKQFSAELEKAREKKAKDSIGIDHIVGKIYRQRKLKKC